MTHRIDPYSETWRAVEDHAKQVIEHGRTALEATGTGQERTEFQRGRIAAMRGLLGLLQREQDPTLPPSMGDLVV